MKSRVVVVGLIEKDGKYLLGQKAKDAMPYPNTWHIPGGGVRLEEESLKDALRREIKEETGIEIKNIQPLAFGEDEEQNKFGEMTHYLFLQYKAEYSSGEAVASDDMAIIEWFSKPELKELNLNRPSAKLFKKLGLI